MIRSLPYVDGLVAGWLREQTPGAMVATELPAVAVRTYPLIVATAVPTSGSPRNMTLVGLSVVDVQCWTTDHKRGCADLAEHIRNLMWRLWAHQIVRPEGHVTSLTVPAQPAPIPSDDTSAPWRYQALYALRVRP